MKSTTIVAPVVFPRMIEVFDPDRKMNVPAGAVQLTQLFCSRLCVPVLVTPVEVRDHVDCATVHETVMLTMYVRRPTPAAAMRVPVVPAPEIVTVVRSGEPTKAVVIAVLICPVVGIAAPWADVIAESHADWICVEFGIATPTAAVMAAAHAAWAPTAVATAAADGSAEHVVWRVDSAELVARPDWICATEGIAAPAAAVRAAAHDA